jgi:outer membrane PBP1 activator LpoA protein
MNRLILLAATAALLGLSPAQAQDKLKIGVIATLSGPPAVLGQQLRNGFNLAVKTLPGPLTDSSVSFDMRVSRERRSEIAELLMSINAQLWLGHFDLWSEDGTVLFRHVLIFPDSRVSAAQCEALLHLSIEACEHYYPAFQFVLWGGKSAQEAMAAAVLECAGQA